MLKNIKNLIGYVIAFLAGAGIYYTLILPLVSGSQNKQHTRIVTTDQAYLKNSMTSGQDSADKSLLFSNLANAVTKFIDDPSEKNKAKLLQQQSDLNHALNKTLNFYGYNVARLIKMYQVWQHLSIEKILKTPNKGVGAKWVLVNMQYQIVILNAISKSYEKFQLSVYSSLLYKSYNYNAADKKTLDKMRALYKSKIKPLMSSAVENLKNNASVFTCVPKLVSTWSPDKLAANIAVIQYGSRYCPRFTTVRANEWCNRVKLLPEVDSKKSALQISLATCAIAKDRMKKDMELSNQKYGGLSYIEYYNKNVLPLIPKYHKLLAQKVKTDYLTACELRSLPIVNYRDPGVDAQIAAFVQYGPTLCQKYVNKNNGEASKILRVMGLSEAE